MATSQDYIDFVMDQLHDIKLSFRYKKMFGEYCVYANEKPISLVCDEKVFIKMLPCLETLMHDSRTGFPYEGAKEHYILDIEDSDLIEKLIPILEENTPLPKPKKRKKE